MKEASLTQQETLIAALQRRLKPPVERVETHISWVLLAGEYAYKFKKALNLGFLDFSSLEKRRLYCTEELRLNRRLAPDLYLEVVSVSGSAEQPLLCGPGPTIEYAVRMRRFPQSGLLDRVLERGELSDAVIDQLAGDIARFHDAIAVSTNADSYGTPEHIHQLVLENFRQIRACCRGLGFNPELDALEQWSEREYQAHRADFAARKSCGRVRECHGDLHLGNIVLLQGHAVPFDGIEFNENLRWIDVISEVAFLSMDLCDRDQPRLARRFLNGYLERTGDYDGLKVLRYYLVYRAMVRAKVIAIRAGQEAGAAEQGRLRYLLKGYIELGQKNTCPARPFLAITHGLSGSGKSTVTRQISEAFDAIRVRSDVERKRLYGLKSGESSLGRETSIYSPHANLRTYGKLAELARQIVLSGYPVMVDAAFLRREEREGFRLLAGELGVPFAILNFIAPEQVLRERIEQRMREGGDASEANIDVLEKQMRYVEPLDDSELASALSVREDAAFEIIKRLEKL